jgi:para-nitrobenzyl esterase
MTDKGNVQGAALTNVREFLNIPYAVPPVGDQRWKPPGDAPAWTSTRNATSAGNRCPQYNLLSGAPDDGTDEDCLTVNVWTPLAATTKAPIMLFIHGGNFVSGSGSELTYNGANLAAVGNVIVVTFNYRLGPFGFLAHPALATDSPSSNFGLLDQRAAFQWVQRNAGAFGGDASNVTIFGESAGAFSVCTHLAMPKSAGLFNHALMESGACSGPVYFALADATTQGTALGTALGCTDASTAASCMRSKAPSDVLQGLTLRDETIGPTGYMWGPIVGDVELPQLPSAAIKAGTFTKVPLLLGTNLNEGQLFTALYFGTLGATDAQGIVTWMFGAANASAILAQYPAANYPSPKEQVADIFTDGAFTCPTRRLARGVSGAGGKVFLYQFTYPFQVMLAPGAKAAHGFELPFVFGNDFYGTRLNESQLPLSATIQGYWTRFAAVGDPNGGSAPPWPTYSASSDDNLQLDTTPSVATGTKKALCDFWDTVSP